MIKGIAARLGLAWGLSDRWAPVAVEAMRADARASLPVWSAAEPQASVVQTTAKPPLGAADQTSISFHQVTSSLRNTARLFVKYAQKNIARLARTYFPPALRDSVVRALLFLQDLRASKSTATAGSPLLKEVY
jgi:hypothetical protein